MIPQCISVSETHASDKDLWFFFEIGLDILITLSEVIC